jgi:nucleotide-binding universal stress UspA family protein
MKGDAMKILVGYDGSNAAKDALQLAVEHANAFNAEIHIATSRSSGDVDELELIREAELGLERAKKIFDDAGIESKTHLLIRGLSPGEDLVRFAGEQEVGGIIIGVKRRSKVGKAIFGSNAHYIILNAPCPVTTVR